jgi:hypothetical protein
MIDLVNGKIVNFCGFAESEGHRPTARILTPLAFIFVKVPGKTFKIG